MKNENRYIRPSAEQWEIMKQLRRDTKKAGIFRLDQRARLTVKEPQ